MPENVCNLRDKDELLRKIQEIKKHNPSLGTIRGAGGIGIPKEFEELIEKKDKKSLGKSLLSAFRHDHEEDTRSQKHSSFDTSSYQEGSLVDTPAVA